MESEKKNQSPVLSKGVLAVVLMVAVVLAACAFLIMQNGDNDAADGIKFEVDHVTYKVTSSITMEVEVSSFDNEVEDLIIPSIVSDGNVHYTVTAIGEKAFQKYRTTIGSSSQIGFIPCPIKTIEIPDTVKEIKENAFYGTRLTMLTIPETVKTIRSGAFFQCNELTDLKIIGHDKNLEKDSLKIEGLVCLTMPIKLKVVAGNSSVFGTPSDLDLIIFTGESGVGHNYSSKNDSSDNYYDKTVWNQILVEKALSLNFEEGITHIGDNMFRGCKYLSKVTLPSSLCSIGKNAFADSGLRVFEFPETTSFFGEGAFSGCTRIKTIEIPDSIRQISARSFENCTSLEDLVLHDDIVQIEDYAFMNCSLTTQLELPEYIVQIGKSAFENTGLVKLVIPMNTTLLAESAFKNCVSIDELAVPVHLDTVVSNDNPAFEGCTFIEKVIFTKGTGHSLDYDDNTYTPWRISNCLKSVVFEDGVLNVGDNMFKGCQTLFLLKLSSSVTKIGDNAFSGCSSLVDLSLFYIQEIGKNAFDGCTSVECVTFSPILASIGEDAFKDFRFFDRKGNSVPTSVETLMGKTYVGSIDKMVMLGFDW